MMIRKEIDPDEIFLDSQNLPDFDTQQFEGRIEKPIEKRTVLWLGYFFLVIGLLLGWKMWTLQIMHGSEFAERSRSNMLKQIPFFADRGVITDRNGVELAWNNPNRVYYTGAGLSHLVGYLGLPGEKESKKTVYYPDELIGRSGVEKEYDSLLRGQNGLKIVEADVHGKIQSESVYTPPVGGKTLALSIDSKVQEKLYESIRDLVNERGFVGGAGVIMDINTGEILAITSYPEYSSQAMSDSDDTKINEYLDDAKKPFLFRAVSGVYAPGSIVKPFMALAALNEKIITPEKKILSTGSISLPNPYFPDKKSVFLDWKAHGYVDMRHALAVSSDVYFYEIGGGYESQKGLGINAIDNYVRKFGFGTTTGIDIEGEAAGTIPTPAWKAENFNGEKWLIGDTYHTVIGQYGFNVTPLQIARAIGGIARDGVLVTPRIVKGAEVTESEKINIPAEYFNVVKEGMRMSATEGTAIGLNTHAVEIAAKTGTAELGVSKKYVNSWVTGFFPYSSPRYSFAVVMERGPRTNTVGATYAMRKLVDWMAIYASDYLANDPGNGV